MNTTNNNGIVDDSTWPTTHRQMEPTLRKLSTFFVGIDPTGTLQTNLDSLLTKANNPSQFDAQTVTNARLDLLMLNQLSTKIPSLQPPMQPNTTLEQTITLPPNGEQATKHLEIRHTPDTMRPLTFAPGVEVVADWFEDQLQILVCTTEDEPAVRVKLNPDGTIAQIIVADYEHDKIVKSSCATLSTYQPKPPLETQATPQGLQVTIPNTLNPDEFETDLQMIHFCFSETPWTPLKEGTAMPSQALAESLHDLHDFHEGTVPFLHEVLKIRPLPDNFVFRSTSKSSQEPDPDSFEAALEAAPPGSDPETVREHWLWKQEAKKLGNIDEIRI